MEVLTLKERKDGIKYLIVPKHSLIKKGDLVLVTSNLKLIHKFQMEEKNGGKGKDN